MITAALHVVKVAEVSCLNSQEDQRRDASATFDSDEGVPLAVAKRVFGEDPKAIIEELNQALIA